MFQDWNKYRSTLKDNVGSLAKMQPEFMKGVAQMNQGAAEHQHLDAKTRELISLAVAVTTRCDGCLAVHVEAAAKQGATREEIAEALSVAINLNTGAAMVYTARALDAFDNLPNR